MKTENNLSVFDRKIFTSPCAKFYSDTIYIVFVHLHITADKIPIVHFLEMSSY